MPGRIKKVNGYRVTWGGKVKAKRTTKKKGKRLLNLLRGIKHGWKPTGRPARDIRKRKKKARMR